MFLQGQECGLGVKYMGYVYEGLSLMIPGTAKKNPKKNHSATNLAIRTLEATQMSIKGKTVQLWHGHMKEYHIAMKIKYTEQNVWGKGHRNKTLNCSFKNKKISEIKLQM